jgi:hypothetical protein
MAHYLGWGVAFVGIFLLVQGLSLFLLSRPEVECSGGEECSIAVFIPTIKTHRARTVAAFETWAHYFTNVAVVIDEIDPSLPVPNQRRLNVTEDGHFLKEKVISTLEEVLAWFPTAQWFLKADDDTFICPPVLVKTLALFDPRTPLQLGFRWMEYEPQFCSGGAGYVLSRAAVEGFSSNGALRSCMFSKQLESIREEDVALSLCFEQIFGESCQHIAGFYPSIWKDEIFAASKAGIPLVSVHGLVDPDKMMGLQRGMHPPTHGPFRAAVDGGTCTLAI